MEISRHDLEIVKLFFEGRHRESRGGGHPAAGGEVVGILSADDFYFDAQVLAMVARGFEDPALNQVLTTKERKWHLDFGTPADLLSKA